MKLIILVTILAGSGLAEHTEQDAKPFLDDFYTNVQIKDDVYMSKLWASDTADDAAKDQAKKDLDAANTDVITYEENKLREFVNFKWRDFQDPELKRKSFAMASTIFRELSLPDAKLTELFQVKGKVRNLAQEQKIKEYKSADNAPLLKTTDVDEKLKNVDKDADQLNHYWKEVHEKVALPARDLFNEYMGIQKELAEINGRNNYAEILQEAYEFDNFEQTVTKLNEDVKPLFLELHAYIRHKLWVAHGQKDDIINPKGPIPASLLGFQWGATALPLYDLLKPFPDTQPLDINPKLQGKSVKDMAKTAESFYTSMGLSPLPNGFDQDSVLEKKGSIDCTPRVYAFAEGNDRKFRLKVCAQPTQDGHILLHNWIGYLEYAMALKDLPYFFKRAPITAWDNAWGQSMTDFSMAPDYLKSIGLLDNDFQPDYALKINTLFKKALENLFFLPFGLAWDQWRWRVAEGKIKPEQYNCEYWSLRSKLQGVEPPIPRTNNDFDPGSRLNYIAGDKEHIMYFIAEFVKLNLIRGLCKTAGKYEYNQQTVADNDLVFCDIHGNQEVGKKLNEMLHLGASQSWADSLEKVTGSRQLESSAVNEYYEPLLKWLKEENQRNHVETGWTESNRCK